MTPSPPVAPPVAPQAHERNELSILNCQQSFRIRILPLRQIVCCLLESQLALQHYTLGLQLVDDLQMTLMNEQFVGHAGTTDVISFDHRDSDDPLQLHGDLFVCTEEAIRQSRRYHVTPQAEVARYVIHGVLHLLGHDDQRAADRRHMKAAEGRLLKQLSELCRLESLGRPASHFRPRTRLGPTRFRRRP